MDETVRYLRQFVTPEMMRSSLEDLVKSYQITNDDRLISALFIKLLPTTKLITAKYTSVKPEESVSHIMTTITDLALSFDTSQNTKFTTFYSRCLERLMYGLLKPYTYKKRQCPTELHSLQEPAYIGGFNDSNAILQDVIPDSRQHKNNTDLEIYNSLHNMFDELTANVFICIAQGYSRPETAEQLQIPLKTVYSIINKNKSALYAILR